MPDSFINVAGEKFSLPVIVTKPFQTGFRSTSSWLICVKYEIAVAGLRSVLLRIQAGKAGFRPDQPRWPRGNGESSGRWSGNGGVFELVGRRAGHHVVPQSITRSPEFDLSDDARKVFRRDTTGPLYGAHHVYDELHRNYNSAVTEELRSYIRERNIVGSAMTKLDAEDFLKRIYASRDVRIRAYNLELYRQKLLHILRRFGSRGRE